MSEKQIKRGEEGERICDQNGCEFPAMYTCMWAGNWTCQCLIHIQGVVNLGGIMGDPTPKNSLRKMTFEEMLPDA